MDHGNGRSPVTLPRNTPVPDAIIHGFMTDILLLKIIGNAVQSLAIALAIERPRVYQDAPLHIGLGHLCFIQIGILGFNDHTKLQAVFLGKLKIPLIVRGNRHDGAGAVVKKDKIGHKDRDLLAGHRIQAVSPRKNPFFGGEIGGSHEAVHFQDTVHEIKDLIFLRQPLDKISHHGVLRRQTHECSTIEGILTGGEHFNGFPWAHHGKLDGSAMAFPDPVFLHAHNPIRPTGKFFTVFEHVIGIIGDFKEPAVHLLDGHFLFRMSPAAPIFNLLIGQNRLAFFTPVHMGFLTIGQTLFIHFDKDQLLPSIILGIAGGQLTIPIIAEPHPFQLGFHGIDILISPARRMGIIFDSRVFRRHAECVPAHWVQHVFSAHFLVSGHHVADGVISHMANMYFTGWVGKHLQEIVFFL